MAADGFNRIGAVCPFVAFVMESLRGFIRFIGFIRFTD